MSDLRVDTISASNGTSPVELTKQNAAKAFCTWDMTETNVIKDSLAISSLTDDSTGINTLNFPPMGNAVYPVTACFHSDTTGSNANIIRVRDLPTTTTAKMHTSASQAGNGNSNLDMPLAYTVIHGGLA